MDEFYTQKVIIRDTYGMKIGEREEIVRDSYGRPIPKSMPVCQKCGCFMFYYPHHNC